MDVEHRIRGKLASLYGIDREPRIWERLRALLEGCRERIPRKRFQLTQRDVVLITYGDSFRRDGEPPLAVLRRFLTEQAAGTVSIVHLLPFFPYSSDDGFSVVDYKAVDPSLGTWEHVEALGGDFELMFDLVINHVSSRSREFQEYLRGNPAFADFFIAVEPGADLSAVFRPRALPLTTRFETDRGPVQVWTTFSEDQIDLNFANPEVLLYMAEVLLFYLSRGASIIRLDAIAYLWKEPGTSCLHLPQTHTMVKLLRDLVDHAAPHAKILTETNVPHRENLSYFGDGNDEAHMVYNFALPPLTAHALLSGDASVLTRWAAGLKLPSDRTWFYNFTASHDGIGVLPAQGLLTREQIDRLAAAALQRGGRIGYKSNPDGSRTAYELNISLFDLLSDPAGGEPAETTAARFLASQAVALTLAGLPALYYHSLVGSGNDQEGVRRTGTARAINREKLDLERLAAELGQPGSRRSLVMGGLKRLLSVRRELPAFHPSGSQRVLELDRRVLAVERTPPEGPERPSARGPVLALINMSGKQVSLRPGHPCKRDVLSGTRFDGEIHLEPYQVVWLTR